MASEEQEGDVTPFDDAKTQELQTLFKTEAGNDVDLGGYNIVWEVEQTTDPQSGKSEYWWNILPGAALPSPYDTYMKPVYVPFVVRSRPGEIFFLTTVRWNELRQLPFSEGRLNWASSAPWKRNLFLAQPDGTELLYQTIVDDENPDRSSPYWVKFWDSKFSEGQDEAVRISEDDPRLDGRWSKVQMDWKKCVGGKFVKYNDSREFENHVDGIGFAPTNYGFPPERMSQYVKLSSARSGKTAGAATQLVFYDLKRALAQGIDEDEIYMAKKYVDGLLVDAPGFFKKYGNVVAIRNKTGQVQVIECTNPKVQSNVFWREAIRRGLAEPPVSRAVRSRNVKGLQLLFVVLETSGGLTTELLLDLIRTANANSCVPIGQSVKVCTEAEFKLYRSEVTDSLCMLGQSPFGEYETWIENSDLVSYLNCYPGYDLPQSVKDLRAIENTLGDMLESRTPSVTQKDDEMEKKKRIVETETSDMTWPGSPPQDAVRWQTVLAAAGKRKNYPSQNQLMGGSASTVAKVADWRRGPADGVDGRVGGIKDPDTKIEWDSPGVTISEWLHRTAFSWGHLQGPGFNQTSPNFIFGSSEANSLMTRYEKAWQSLFAKDHVVKKRQDVVNGGLSRSDRIQGFLWTRNTYPTTPIISRSISKGGGIVATKLRYGEEDWRNLGLKAMTEKSDVPVYSTTDGAGAVGGVAQGPNYWGATIRQPNLSFCLEYKLELSEYKSLNCLLSNRLNMDQRFYAFQRGFFTRIEADIDQLLLDKWTDDAVESIRPVNPGINLSNSIPHLSYTVSKLSINPLTAKVVDASSKKAVTLGVNSLSIASAATPSQLPHAEVWRNAVRGGPVTVGGADIKSPHVAMMNREKQMVLLPLGSSGSGSGNAPAGTSQALVASTPLSGSDLAAVAGDQIPNRLTTVSTPAEVANAADDSSAVPKGFVLSGTIKLFGILPAPLYVYHGNAATGMRQIVPIPTTSGDAFKISDYVPSLAGTDYEALKIQNIRLVYNEFTVGENVMDTWLEADMAFSGPLQPVSDFLKNVCRQEQPDIRVKMLLSRQNDWSKPVELTGLILLGVLTSMSVRIGGLIEITSLGASVGISHNKEPWPPYKTSWTHSLGFSGSMNIEMPHEIAPAEVKASIMLLDGIVTMSAAFSNEVSSGAGFAGIQGLELSELGMRTTFATGSAPSVVDFNVTAMLVLRDSTLYLSGFYAKHDWELQCYIYEFDFNNLRNLYEDLFGTPLHLSNHEIVLGNLSFNADPSGITMSGTVTVEGYAAADATISLGRLGVQISGSISGSIPLNGDVVLKNASLDIFIGRQDDTTRTGPGTSFMFAIAGTVDVASQEISASMYLDKDSGSGATIWTVVGSFSGVMSLSQIAPPLKGTFLDLALQQATFIASNVDGAMVDGAPVPAAYPVAKGVQIAARLGPIKALDSSLGNMGAPASGLTLQALYSAQTSAFELGINLASPRQMSMKSGTVWSGDISLQVLAPAAAPPTLVLTADFFVQTPNQAEPLKFSGGLSMSAEQAELFIELANQWWNDPFGLSPELRLGPDLALQIGIVYASPVYPSQLGVTAGLAVGSLSGKAALSVSDAPNDELIMLEIQNLGIRDLVDFASKLLETTIPEPVDFLRFKDVNFYLSTGATIGTMAYPPGASFSCDAVLFGDEATVSCSVSKAQGQIEVQGTLQRVDVGPVTVSGFDDGTLATVQVAIGAAQQSLRINGGVRIGELHSRADVEAELLPLPAFSLKTELDFSTHLTFALEADMRSSSNNTITAGVGTAASWLKAIDLDVKCSFHQDVLDFVSAQVNMQVLTAKHAVDDGVAQAQATLAKAKADFEQDVAAASRRVDRARETYEAKATAAEDALGAEKVATAKRTAQLQANVDSAIAVLNTAIAQAQGNLASARDARDLAVKNAEQQVKDAQAKADSGINQHLQALASAKDDMQRRFGAAVAQVQSAQDSVNGAQSAVNDAQRDYNNAQNDCNNAQWYEKIYKCPAVAGFWTRLEAVQAGLATANGVLEAAKAVIESPGYIAAQGAIDAYQAGVGQARAAADGLMAAANATLQQTITTQDGLVSAAQTALTAVQTTGAEKLAADAAKGALTAYQTTEQGVLAGLQATVDGLSKTSEAVAFGAAQAALKLAQANTHDIDVASASVALAQQSGEAVLDMGQWMVDHVGNILNIRSMDAMGDLRALCDGSSALKMHIAGMFADKPVDFSVDFMPGRTAEFLNGAFRRLVDDVKQGVVKIVNTVGGQ